VIAVIGIDRYVTWPRLANAVSDAAGALRLFKRLGFEEVTTPLFDDAATGEALRRLVTDDLGQLSPNDSLVLFFAGHGHTHTARFGNMSVKTGCVIPVDAARPGGHVSSSWLRLDTWLSDIARLPPRHILVIVDACHSGVALNTLHKWRGEGPELTTELAALQTRRSRRIITSALDDQHAIDSGPYPGHSLFTGCLIEALSGGLAKDGQCVATGREIGQYVQKRVRSYPLSTQTPDFGTFELDDRGDIVVPILFEGIDPNSAASMFDTRPNWVAMNWSRRSRIGLWIAVALITSASGVWIALVGTLSDRASDTRTVAPPSARDAGVISESSPPNPADATVLDTTPSIVHEPKEVSPIPPPPNRSPKPAPANTPSPVRRSSESVPGSDRCSKERFAALCAADSPPARAVSAAVSDLKACHKAGALSETDFNRYWIALIAK